MSPVDSPPRKIRKADEEDVQSTPPDGIIRLEVDKVSTLDFEGRFSPEVEVNGVNWKMRVLKGKAQGHVLLFTSLVSITNKSSMWGIDVKAEYILVNADRTKNVNIERLITFQRDLTFKGFSLATWEDLLNEKEGFIKDDKIVVEIRFSILNMRGIRSAPTIDFTDQNERSHDITFVIDGEKIYVNKGILAVNSPVFHTMFYGNFAEKEKKEIELKDVNRDNFIEMLRVIYPMNHKITDANVNFLLKLGDRFQIKLVLDLAEAHLIASTFLGLAPKILLSDQYRLVMLQDHCLNQLKTMEDVKKVKEAPEYKDLSDATRVVLLERVFE